MASSASEIKQITFHGNIIFIGNDFHQTTKFLINNIFYRLNETMDTVYKLFYWKRFYEEKLTTFQSEEDNLSVRALKQLNKDIIDQIYKSLTNNEESLENANLLISDLSKVQEIIKLNKLRKDGLIQEGFSEKMKLICDALNKLSTTTDQIQELAIFLSQNKSD